MGVENQTSDETGKTTGESVSPKKTRERWSINTDTGTLKRAGQIFGGVLLVGASLYYIPQTRIGRVASSYFTATLEAVGIKTEITNPAENLEANLSQYHGKVRDLYDTNKNQMLGGMYNQIMFTEYAEFISIENIFLTNARSKERREYIQKQLDPKELEKLFTVYSQVAPKADIVQSVAEMQSVLDMYLATALDDRTRAAYGLDRSLWAVTNNLLNDEGKKAVVTKVYEKMSPEAIAETAVPYMTTPQARSQTVEAILGSMSPEERGVFMAKYSANLPQEEVDTLAVALIPSMSLDGYTRVGDAITNQKIDDGFEKGKQVLDTIKRYVKK